MSKPKSRQRAKKPKEDENKETLAWKVLSDVQTKEVMEVETVEEVQEKVVAFLQISQFESDLKEAAVLDYYVAALWWAKEQQFSSEQTSAFYTVVHSLLENIKDKQMNVVDNLCEFKKFLAGIGLEHSEASGGLECFNMSQAKLIADYLYASIFQHYKLYEFLFSTTQAEEIIGTELEIEVAPPCDRPWPPPLEEAVRTDLHQAHIATPPATPEPQVGEEAGEAEASLTAEAEGEAELSAEDAQKEADILAQLTPEQVKTIMQEVFDEMLPGLQTEVAQKLRDKENAFIARINKIHKVAEK